MTEFNKAKAFASGGGDVISGIMGLLNLSNQAKAEREQLRLRMAERTKQGTRELQAFGKNIRRIQEQDILDNVSVDMAAEQARDNLILSRATSGLKGTSIDELDAQITRQASDDKVLRQREKANLVDDLSDELRANADDRLTDARLEKTRVMDINAQYVSNWLNIGMGAAKAYAGGM